MGPPGRWIIQASVHFAPSTASLLPQCGEKLTSLIAFLKEHPSVDVALVGHADQREMASVASALPRNRVHVVRATLLLRGVAASRIVAAPLRDNHARVCAEDTDTCREKNRRVEILTLQRI